MDNYQTQFTIPTLTCSECNKTFKSQKRLNEHRAYMRKQGQGHEELKRVKGKSGASMETGSTLGGKQVTLDFFQEDGSVGPKKGQLDAKEELMLAKGLTKEPGQHKDPAIAAQIQMVAAQFQKEGSPNQALPQKGFAPFNTNPFLPIQQKSI